MKRKVNYEAPLAYLILIFPEDVISTSLVLEDVGEEIGEVGWKTDW